MDWNEAKETVVALLHPEHFYHNFKITMKLFYAFAHIIRSSWVLGSNGSQNIFALKKKLVLCFCFLKQRQMVILNLHIVAEKDEIEHVWRGYNHQIKNAEPVLKVVCPILVIDKEGYHQEYGDAQVDQKQHV